MKCLVLLYFFSINVDLPKCCLFTKVDHLDYFNSISMTLKVDFENDNNIAKTRLLECMYVVIGLVKF